MVSPLSRGNFIVLKGDKRASGKNLVVSGTINEFLKESKDNRVVYVGQSKKTADEYFSKVSKKEQIILITPSDADDS